MLALACAFLLLLPVCVSLLLACFEPYSSPSYRRFLLAGLELDEYLLQLSICHWYRYFSRLCQLDQLQLQLVYELGLHHFQVGQSLPGFGC